MERLTEKEALIYTQIPAKFREYLTQNFEGPCWVKSEYGLGYSLKLSNEYTISDGGISWTSSTALYTGTPDLNTLKKTLLNAQESFKVPLNPDDILNAAKYFANNFLNAYYNLEKTQKDPAATLPLLERCKLSVSQENEKFITNIKLDNDEWVVIGDTARAMALSVYSDITKAITQDFKPSITSLKNVKNICKNDDGINSVYLSNTSNELLAYQYTGLLHSEVIWPFARYIEDAQPEQFTGPYAPMGEIDFFEGTFLIYKEQSLSRGTTYIQQNTTISPSSVWSQPMTIGVGGYGTTDFDLSYPLTTVGGGSPISISDPRITITKTPDNGAIQDPPSMNMSPEDMLESIYKLSRYFDDDQS